MKNKEEKKRYVRCTSLKLAFLFILSLAMTLSAFAQSKTVTGTVLDSTGESIIGANVMAKGTANGTILKEVTLYVNDKKVGKMKPDSLRRIVWKDIKLDAGSNTIRIEGKSGKQSLTDSCGWTLRGESEQ